RAEMHTPVSVTEEALLYLKETGADGLVAVGGGSTIGLAKAVSLRRRLPKLVVATTYAGSEMTPIVGQTEDGRKTTLRSMEVLPDTVIYDPELTLSLPFEQSVASGINAMAHAVEALYAENRNPVTAMFAQEGVGALYHALHNLADQPGDIEARKRALYGAWLCAICLATSGMALHHKLCHVLGGMFDLPHAETHAIVLPHAIAYNAAATPLAIARLKNALQTEDPAAAFFALLRGSGLPAALRDVGMPEAGVAAAVDSALQGAYWNPAPLKREVLTAALSRAWSGEPPEVADWSEG
ncbi:MAG: maleylacetate reductase, partial [Rhizobiaceae bacterium]|nr:maleylacetate reductase [Rhizobiaceae bacterium]